MLNTRDYISQAQSLIGALVMAITSNDFSAESKLETVSELLSVMDGLLDKAQEAAKKASAKKAAKVDPAKNTDWLEGIKASAEEFSEALPSMNFEEDADRTFVSSRVDDVVERMEHMETLLRQNASEKSISSLVDDTAVMLLDIDDIVEKIFKKELEENWYYKFSEAVRNGLVEITDAVIPDHA